MTHFGPSVLPSALIEWTSLRIGSLDPATTTGDEAGPNRCCHSLGRRIRASHEARSEASARVRLETLPLRSEGDRQDALIVEAEAEAPLIADVNGDGDLSLNAGRRPHLAQQARDVQH